MADHEDVALDHAASRIYRALTQYRHARRPNKLNGAGIDSTAFDAIDSSTGLDDGRIHSYQFTNKVPLMDTSLFEPNEKQDTEMNIDEIDIILDVNGLREKKYMEPKANEHYASDEKGGSGGIINPVQSLSDKGFLTLPENIAVSFAKAAASELSTSEINWLLEFLEKPSSASAIEIKLLVDQELERFYMAEIAESGQPRNRLARPSGPVDAEVGIMLHCQSRDGEIGEFWDQGSKTVQILAEKGISPDYVYCFDWHFRADETASRDNGRCFTNAWTEAQRKLHSQFTQSLLDILPLKWLIVGGSCARKGYRKTLQQYHNLILRLSPGTQLEFDLDFSPNRLRRITTYIKHPAASLYSRHQTTSFAGAQDLTFNFFMWLVNKDQSQNSSFISTMGSHGLSVYGNCMQDLWAYREKEQQTGTLLELEDYQPSFLRWATKYLQKRPEDVLVRGKSLAEVVTAKFGDNVSQRLETRYSAKDFWDGEEVSVTRRGEFTILLRNTQKVLKYSGGQPLARAMRKYGGPATLHFRSNEFYLHGGGNIIWKESREALVDIQGGDDWLQQIEAEVRRKDNSASLKEMVYASASDLTGQLTTAGHEAKSKAATNSPELPESADLTPSATAHSSGTGRVGCPDCSRWLKNKASFKTHYNNMHLFKDTKCPYGCGLVMKSRTSMQSHVRALHDPDFEPQRCAFYGCMKETKYTLWEKYGQHLRGAHGLTSEEARKYHPNIHGNFLTRTPRKQGRFKGPLGT